MTSDFLSLLSQNIGSQLAASRWKGFVPLKVLIGDELEKIPNSDDPGVYCCADSAGRIQYIGSSIDALGNRFLGKDGVIQRIRAAAPEDGWATKVQYGWLAFPLKLRLLLRWLESFIVEIEFDNLMLNERHV